MTGATGVVGAALRRALASRFHLVGLVRSSANIRDLVGRGRDDDHTEWRNCDLFSLLQLEEQMRGADYAIHLASSIIPSARLVQGSFADIDLIMADNLVRAARSCGIKQIICLGGLLPGTGNLSERQTSQVEVEKTLGSGTAHLTALRAGLIVGPSGSYFQIVINLVRRLPVMVLPEWTLIPIQPIAIDDVVRAVQLCLGSEMCFGRQFDLGGPDAMTFRDMLERTGAALGRRRLMVNVPFRSPVISKAWVSLLGGASRFVVGPLVESLRAPLTAKANPVQERLLDGAKSFEEALRATFHSEGRPAADPRDSIHSVDVTAVRLAGRVRSIQRLPLPIGWTARQVTAEYYRWLPAAIWPVLRCVIDGGVVRVCLGFTRWVLIEFTPSPRRSSEDRQLLYITGGALARTRNNKRGRIEFREILDRHCMLVAIHDFTPTLPWVIYRFTQALVHLWVARSFGQHLADIESRRVGPPDSAP